MLEFQLFRIKVFATKPLFPLAKSPSEILIEAVNSQPASDPTNKFLWRIGDVSKIADDGLYFQLGRLTKSILEMFQNGRFIEEEFPTAPFTHVILDTKLEVCGIAKKAKLSPNTGGIANHLVRLLNESEIALKYQAEFDISPISDPDDLIDYLKKAYSIKKFQITFTRPNPIDPKKLYQEPMEKLLIEVQGERGQTQVEGANLNSDTLEKLTRSAASSGNEATAWFHPEQDKPKVKKHLRDNPVILHHIELVDERPWVRLLGQIRSYLKKIQGRQLE